MHAPMCTSVLVISSRVHACACRYAALVADVPRSTVLRFRTRAAAVSAAGAMGPTGKLGILVFCACLLGLTVVTYYCGGSCGHAARGPAATRGRGMAAASEQGDGGVEIPGSSVQAWGGLNEAAQQAQAAAVESQVQAGLQADLQQAKVVELSRDFGPTPASAEEATK